MPEYPKPAPRPARRRGHNSLLAAPDKPMNKRSPTNKGARAWRDEYLPKRERFLTEHRLCEVRIQNRCTGEATEVHHMVQRSLDPSVENLLDERHWLASCHSCNSWISDNSAEARLLGVELSPHERDDLEGK